MYKNGNKVGLFHSLVLIAVVSGLSSIAFSQPIAQADATTSANLVSGQTPRLIKFSGVLQGAPGQPRIGTFQVSFSIFDGPESAAPLWSETQSVIADAEGKFSVLLGKTTTGGLPSSIFTSGEARWLGMSVDGVPEPSRTMLVSVPYALKAADADTLSGMSLAAILSNSATAKTTSVGPTTKATRLSEPSQAAPDISAPGDSGGQNFLGKFSADGVNLIASQVFDNGTNVGINTTSPSQKLDVNGNIAFSSAPKNAGFAGFNISGDGVFRAGINMPNLLGQGDLTRQGAFFTMDTRLNQSALAIWTKPANSSTETERVTVTSTGNVGIGNPSPTQLLDVGGNVNVGGNLILASSPLNTGMRGFNLSGDGVVRVGINMPNLFGEANNARQGAFFSMDTRLGQSALSIFTKQAGSSTETESFTLQSGGNVGISNTSPVARLDVSQNAPGAGSFAIGTPPPSAIHGDSTALSGFITGVLGTASTVDGFGILGENLASGQGSGNSAGVRGITANTGQLGTGVWGDALQGSGDNVGVFGRSASNAGTGVFGQATSLTGDVNGVYGTTASTSGTGVFGEVTATTAGSPPPAAIYGKASSAGVAGLFDISASPAALLIGRTNLANVFRIDSTGKGFFNGGTQTGGADFAESVTVLEERSSYEPGDVIAIDTNGVRRFSKTDRPYSTLVAGIFSTKPGVLATKHTIDDPRLTSEEIPLAVVGIVPCKVSNENGEINAGDLLVSSSTPGFAMKGTDRNRMTGAVVGKALQAMHGKNGVIEVLVSLQ